MGHRHAGENLAAVLKQRAAESDRPIQMCDVLSRNMPMVPWWVLLHADFHVADHALTQRGDLMTDLGLCTLTSHTGLTYQLLTISRNHI
jgi:hypothetical protein